MTIYFAGAEASIDFFRNDCKVNNLLVSFPFAKKNKTEMHDTYFLDSGAYSVATKKIKIDLDDYIEYIKKMGLKTYAALDVIGDAAKSKENYIYMRKNGVEPIPCFHINEPFEYLEYYLSESKYIALGGVALLKRENKVRPWLSHCFSIIKKKPAVKVHGFGITIWNILTSFPFYSVDSTSWQNPARYQQHFDFSMGKLSRISHYTPSGHRFFDKKTQLVRSVYEFTKAEEYLTELWKKRGIVWQS
jgi:hypothetical protein